MLCTYSRDTLNDHGECLLPFPSNDDHVLENNFFITFKNDIPITFNEIGKRKSIGYILTRRRDRKLERNVAVYPQ